MTAAPDDHELMAGVRAAPEPRWDELWAAVDELGQQHQWVEWVPSTQRPDGVWQLGYPNYSQELVRVWRLLAEVGAVVPYDWMQWDGWERYPSGEGLEDAPAADAVRVITGVIRSERFGDGNIEGAMTSGLLPRAIARLRRWYDEERG